MQMSHLTVCAADIFRNFMQSFSTGINRTQEGDRHSCAILPCSGRNVLAMLTMWERWSLQSQP